MRNIFMLFCSLTAISATASNVDYINTSKCGESSNNIFWSCNKLAPGSYNIKDCQCLLYPPSNDDKYADINLTLKQVESFLSDIKLAAKTKDGLIKYTDILYTINQKPYYGNLNCTDSNKKLKHIALTNKFVNNNYELLFNDHIKNVIESQIESEIFVRDNGFMFGDGDIWFFVTENKKILINAINLDKTCPSK